MVTAGNSALAQQCTVVREGEPLAAVPRGYQATGLEGDSPSIELFELFVTYSFYVHRSSGSRIV